MQNLPSTEHQFVEALKAMPIPTPRAQLIDRLNGRAPTHRAPVWALSAAATAAVAATLVVGVSMRPTLSLADVIRATEGQTQYTVITKFESPRPKTIHSYRDGALWRSSYGFGLRDKTIVFDPKHRFVMLDAPRSTPVSASWAESRIERILNPNLKPVVEHNILWNGRRVDRFTVDGVDRSTGEAISVHQELIVDPRTKLPIHRFSREEGTYPRITDYDFSAPPASVFEVSIPTDLKRYDLVAQKREIAKDLAESNAVMVVDEDNHLYVLTPGAKDQSLFVPKAFYIEGLAEPLPLEELVLTNITYEAPKERYALPIGEQYWTVSRSPFDPQNKLHWAERVQKLSQIGGRLDSARTTSQKEDPTIQLHNVKIVRTGDAKFLLESFLDGRYYLVG